MKSSDIKKLIQARELIAEVIRSVDKNALLNWEMKQLGFKKRKPKTK